MRTKFFFVTVLMVTVICVAFFGVRFFLLHKEYDETPLYRKSYTSSSLERGDTRDEETKYFLALEGETLCAYKEENGKRVLLHSKHLEPMLMSDGDVKKLKESIYAENYEDLCLYFESYMS